MKDTLKSLYRRMCSLLLVTITCYFIGVPVQAQEPFAEEDFSKIETVIPPQGVVLEVGGLTTLPNGNLGVSTRRGDIFVIENPTSKKPYFRKFASGLHEVLGLAYKDGAFYCAQRGELTKLIDKNIDGRADVYETIYSWPLSGNYHEYSYGPAIAPDGSFFVTANLGFFKGEAWRGKSKIPWRGWAIKIFEDGRMEPWATGMRSPAGLSIIDGELFYTDNQGEWIASGGLWHVAKGDFMGNPAGLNWTNMPNSPLKLTTDQIHGKVDPRREKNEKGHYIKPQNVVDEEFVTSFEMKEDIPEMRLPAVWLPYGFLGVSTSEPIVIPEGSFRPFEGQVLIGDAGMSMIARVFMEKVNGEYQGASFAFRSGFNSGILRLEWAEDGSLFVGQTRRGWGSVGDADQGLQRLVWNNEIPFEMKTVRAMPDGFEIEFTQPVDPVTAEDLASYSVESFLYKYHPVYGSPPINTEKCEVIGVKLLEGGRKVRIIIDNMRRYYIHDITLNGVREKDHSYPLLHPTAYYTLNNIPEGQKLSMDEVSVRNSSTVVLTASRSSTNMEETIATKSPEKKVVVKERAAKVPEFWKVKGLLVNYTCSSCHTQNKKQVGPSFAEISKRGYNNEKIVELIHNPQPENWPDYATPMPPMPHVREVDALKIAEYINSLTN
jgi:cytochrome c551/c552